MKTSCSVLIIGPRCALALGVFLAGSLLMEFSGASAAAENAGREAGKNGAARIAPSEKAELARSRALAFAQRGWSRPPKTTIPPCKCDRPRDSYPAYPHFAEVEVGVDELRTLNRLRSLPCAPGSRLEILDNGKRVRAQWYAVAVGDLIEEGAQVTVLRDFILSEKPAGTTSSVPRGITAAATCSGDFKSGSNDTNYDIPYGDWTWSDIHITDAPSNAIVTCIDVHYEIVHPYAGDLIVSLTDEDLTLDYTLYDDETDTTPNLNETVTGITDGAGEGVNQLWSLWAYDAYVDDDGYIDTWWIKVYYTVPSETQPHDDCSNAIAVQDGVPYAGSTVGATGDYETWCGYYDVLDVWHAFTATRTGLVTLRVESANFDTTLAVFDQCGGSEQACGDDDCDGTNSVITMRMVAGTTYYVRVAGYDYATGAYTLTVTQHALDLPDAADQPSPSDGASGIATHPVLSWNDSAALASLAKGRVVGAKADRTDEPVPQVIYGQDDRTEEYEVSNPNYLAAGDATVVIVYWSELTNNGDGTFTLPAETFAYWYEDLDPIETGNPLCADEPFRNQPAPGLCSGVLVTPNLIATAGHCMACGTVSDLAVVFGFVMQDASTPALTVSADDVYRCSEVVAYNDGYPDWSLVRLEREVTDHTPLTLQRTSPVTTGQELLVVGHPWGVPRKYDAGGTVRDVTPSTFFQANVDTYIGSSGSPVFDRSTLTVEGLITAGIQSFEVDDSGTCDRSRVCPDTGCPGWEDVTRATSFSAVVPSFDVYLGTNPSNLSLVSSYGVVPWYRPDALQDETTYYWRVVARNAWGTTEGPLWSFQTTSTPDYSPVYRFWSPLYGRHFYTNSENEKNAVIATYPPSVWTYETVAYYAFSNDSQPGLAPVYRFWSPLYGGHFYTISQAEKDSIIATYPTTIWTYEQVAFYAYPAGSQPAGTSPVYRFWSDSLGAHFYTIDEAEKDYVVANLPAWQYESIAWYAYE